VKVDCTAPEIVLHTEGEKSVSLGMWGFSRGASSTAEAALSRAVDEPPKGVPAEETNDPLQFYRAYGGVVFARCRVLLGNDAAAEDATQETFLRVHRHFQEQLRGPDSALAWLYRRRVVGPIPSRRATWVEVMPPPARSAFTSFVIPLG
jgi:hypothetical protein